MPLRIEMTTSKNMFYMLEETLSKKGLLEHNEPWYLEKLIECADSDTSYKMLKAIAVSEIVLFASQFRKNIDLGESATIPINSISIILAGSGEGKDKAVKAIRSPFRGSYKDLHELQKKDAVQSAIRAATKEGLSSPSIPEVYNKFYVPPPPLVIALTNDAAFIDHLAKIEQNSTGAGYMYLGEFGAEISSNKDTIGIFKVISEVYDVGNKAVKPLKDKISETQEIVNLPVSALFVGSQENILYDQKIKDVFKVEFNTKLARRANFCFVDSKISSTNYTSIEEFLTKKEEQEEERRKAITTIEKYIKDVYTEAIKSREPLQLSKEAKELLNIFQEYSKELALRMNPAFPISKLAVTHQYWRALKLAGAYAILGCSNIIQTEHMHYAISYMIEYSEDILRFEIELDKKPYEAFADYLDTLAETTNKVELNIHHVVKHGFIVGKGGLNTKMKELVSLASSYSSSGIFSYKELENKVIYEKLRRVDGEFGVSYALVDTNAIGSSKENKKVVSKAKEIAMMATIGQYKYKTYNFETLGKLLNTSLSFSNFKFKTVDEGAVLTDFAKKLNKESKLPYGVRGADNVIGGTQWLVLDVDDSILDIDDTHELLQDLNHHIALTSNINNKSKFRLIIELNSIVDLKNSEWKEFIKIVSEDLGINIDVLSKSQSYFGYKDRKVLSVVDQEPLDCKEYIMLAKNRALRLEEHNRSITPKEKSLLLKNKFETFQRAFKARRGSKYTSLYGAARKAHMLGMSKEEIKLLIVEISDYWDKPLASSRLENLKIQIDKFGE